MKKMMPYGSLLALNLKDLEFVSQVILMNNNEDRHFNLVSGYVCRFFSDPY
jgi:hypothetical protein